MPPGGLAASRWAPRLTSWPVPPPPQSRFNSGQVANTSAPLAPPAPSTPQQELSRFLKITARMKWKMPFLEEGYQIASDRSPDKTPQQIAAAEIHFKLDFHEFYMLIERAIVHLMGVHGIIVPEAQRLVVVVNGDTTVKHRYHDNVLAMLDNPQNPLHCVLGQEPVRSTLQQAKQLRNQWKGIDDSSRLTRAQLESIEMYKLNEILGIILAGIEHAYSVTDHALRLRLDQGHGPISPADWATDSEAWEFMMDAMDWQAV
ncbi:hypothetical protein F5Y16DRAFT_167592 [Xylariaceae sp. FL0255]|nr:hypothetical protein F5Y16DRAFT_167592 [Xylariaceae sp. FL0255]